VRPNATVAFVAICAVLVAGLGVGAYLTTRGTDTAAYWTGLGALVTLLVNLVRTEQTRQEVNHMAEQVQQVAKQTNGTNSRLQRAALTALAELPPDKANGVLRTLGVTRTAEPPTSTPSGDTHRDERTPLE
jgi:hypothetical protein